MKYTRYGFYAWGENNSPGKVMHNKFSGNKYPWYFLDAGATLPASFGTQGGGLVDNGNNFLGTSNRLNSNGYKVFRNSTVGISAVIETNSSLLMPGESGSLSSPLADYGVQNPLGLVNNDPCLDPAFIVGEGGGGEDEDMEQMMDIVEDDVDYLDHDDVGEWMDESRVYEALDMDNTLRYSSLELQNFYSTRQSALIAKVYDANRAIDLLMDETTNNGNYSIRYNAAVLANNQIVNGEQWEMNEHNLNAIILKLYEGSYSDTIAYDTIYVDSIAYISQPKTQILTQAEQDFVHNLAYSCPFVEGPSVYRARVLNRMVDPKTFFDDRVLCISGSNKNLDLTNIDIDSLYESQITRPPITPRGFVIDNHGDVQVYPNPASSTVIIKYNCAEDGVFELMDAMGQQVLKTDLTNGNKTVEFEAHDIKKGVYFYRCCFKGCKNSYGKLLIE